MFCIVMAVRKNKANKQNEQQPVQPTTPLPAEDERELAIEDLEQELEEEDAILGLHQLACLIDDLRNGSYIFLVEKLTDDIDELINELKPYVSDAKYNEYIKKVKDEYEDIIGEPIEDYQIQFISDIQAFDRQTELYNHCKRIANNYKPHWDGVLDNYKLEHAREKRRKYLIEEAEKASNECMRLGFPDLVQLFKDYQKEQQELLQTASLAQKVDN